MDGNDQVCVSGYGEGKSVDHLFLNVRFSLEEFGT